jgi:hypothetical protein
MALRNLKKPLWVENWSKTADRSTVEADLLIADELYDLSKLVEGRQYEFSRWCSGVSASEDHKSALEIFRELPRLREVADRERAARDIFVGAAKAYLGRSNLPDSTDWLRHGVL